MKKMIRAAVKYTDKIKYFDIDCSLNHIVCTETHMDDMPDGHSVELDLVIVNADKLVLDLTDNFFCKRMVTAESFTKTININNIDFNYFQRDLNKAYTLGDSDLFTRLWNEYNGGPITPVELIPSDTSTNLDTLQPVSPEPCGSSEGLKIIKIAIQRDNSVAYYQVDCTRCLLQYIRSDELGSDFVTKDGFDLFVYDKNRNVDLSFVDFEAFKRVELYDDFLSSIEITTGKLEPENFYTALTTRYDEVGAEMYTKLYKIYSVPKRISALDEMPVAFANSPVVTAVEKMSSVSLPPKHGDLVYLGYRDSKGAFHLNKKVEDNDKATPSDYLNYYTDGNVLMMNNPWSARSFYMLDDMLEFHGPHSWMSSDPMYKHKEAMEFISDSFMTRARQISTYKNEERDIRFTLESYPVNSTFYNSLVEQTSNTLHISPNQLEELYVLQEITQQLDIELSEANEKLSKKPEQSSIEYAGKDYHKETASIMFERSSVPESCAIQTVCKKEETSIMSEKYRKETISSLLTPYKAIIQQAEKETEEALSLTSSINGAVILERDVELFRGLVTSEIASKLQRNDIPLARQEILYNERDLVTVGCIHESGKVFSYHSTNDKESTLYKTDGNVLVAYHAGVPDTILLSEFKHTDNEFVIAENAEEGWTFRIPLTFLQIAKTISTYKNSVRDNLFTIGASKFNSTFYNALCEMTYGQISDATPTTIENALLTLVQSGIVQARERVYVGMNEIDLEDKIQYYSDARFSLVSDWEHKVENNMLLSDSLAIYNKYYVPINSAYHLQLLMSKVQESTMNIKPSSDIEVEKIVNTIMKAVEMAPTEYCLKSEN